MGTQPQFALWFPSTSGDLRAEGSGHGDLLAFLGAASTPKILTTARLPVHLLVLVPKVVLSGDLLCLPPAPCFKSQMSPLTSPIPLPGLYFPLSHTLSPSDRLGYTYI